MTPWSGWWIVVQVVVFLLLIGLALVLLRYFTGKTSRNETTPDALDIAKMRLAKGEITPEEFAEIKNKLSL
jgi:uncharacterized membrane protein